jgi:hypothetical protein
MRENGGRKFYQITSPPAPNHPEYDKNDTLHHPPTDPTCQHQEILQTGTKWMYCIVRVYRLSRLDHSVCLKAFLINTQYVCKNARCKFKCNEPLSAKDCGKHGNGPHRYGSNGMEKWDDGGQKF